MIVRPRFNPAASFTAARSFTYAGVQYAAGDPFDKSGIAPFHLNTLYGSRAINVAAEGDAAPSPVSMIETGGGYYEINAPWLDEPEKVRGKAKAEARRDELAEAGEPLDHHGVSINESGGGWYSVEAAWLDEPEKVQGFDEALRLATDLRTIGAPPDHYALVTVEPIEDVEDAFYVSAPWLEGIETVTGAENAEARAQVIREAGPPEEGYDAEAIAKAREANAVEDAKVREAAEASRAEAARSEAYASGFEITSVTTGEGDDAATVYTIGGNDLDPVDFDDRAAAETRLNELREAGPPEGWTPADA